MPYHDVERIKGSQVYAMNTVDGLGPTKYINRSDILDCNTADSDEDAHIETILDSESDGHSDRANRIPEQFQRDSDTDSEQDIPVRRSTRKTAGKHSNPHRLTKPAIQKTTSCKLSKTDFKSLADAVQSSGSSLSVSLSKELLEAYKHILFNGLMSVHRIFM